MAPGRKAGRLRLAVRPSLSGRDYHALHHENPLFRFSAEVQGERVTWRPYDGVPAVEEVPPATTRPRRVVSTSCIGKRGPGPGRIEDLASPGIFRSDLDTEEAVLDLVAAGPLAAQSGGDDARNFAGFAGPSVTAARLRLPARTLGRRVPRAAGRGQDDRRRVSMVHRLGPRHLHRASRACASRPGASETRARSWSTGRRWSPKGCCPIVFPIMATRPSSIGRRLAVVRRRGPRTSPRSKRAGFGASTRDSAELGPRSHDFGRLTPAARASASAWTTTVCSPRACLACSSRGWTRRSATGHHARASASRSRSRRCG